MNKIPPKKILSDMLTGQAIAVVIALPFLLYVGFKLLMALLTGTGE